MEVGGGNVKCVRFTDDMIILVNDIKRLQIIITTLIDGKKKFISFIF